MSVSSDKELETKLLESGERLLGPLPSTVESLLHLLYKLLNRLKEVEKTHTVSIQNAVSQLKTTLIAERLFKHSNFDVKIATVACITEVMRIYSPVAPYDEDKMREVLQLIVSSFEHLDDVNSLSYTIRIWILNTVAKCQVCVLMLDPEYVALLIEMFQHLFKALRDHHPMEVFLDIKNIMTLVLQESDGIPPELLSIILRYVKKDDEVPLISRRLAEQVLINCASKCKTYLAEAVKSSGVSLDEYGNVVAFICEWAFGEWAFSDLKKNEVVARKKLVGSSGKSVSKSKTDVKQPLEEMSNGNTKRKHSLAKEKASDLQNYDKKLVGSRIKVWWPMDQAYYKGVVHSYDSSKKKHLDQEANQTGRDQEASTMSQKKKAKTGKAQSADKQSKMDISPQMLSPIPRYVEKDDEAPQVSPRCAEQLLCSCPSQVKKYLTEAVKSSSVSIDKQNNVVDSVCEGGFNALEQEEVVSHKKEDKQKAAKVSTPEQTCVSKRRLNLSLPHEGDPAETETPTHKRARLYEVHVEIEKTAAEGEPSCRTHKSRLEPGDPQACYVTHQLAKVKQSLIDTITSVRQFGSELETKEQSIVDTLTSVRQFRSELETKEQSIVDTLASVRQFQAEIKKKEDNLKASLQEVDVLGGKISGINS
ncbi:uncharacterized protein LOC18028757 [Eutrema salsugineum]|uniref:uncharacterized protein LOC18028757 n=1 Tax=Eutrema salsugineum TaxID=72664 RepID=UPI000CED3884|nr:uncharacterized protein LOC18028757 [Eutrema salsugineum]